MKNKKPEQPLDVRIVRFCTLLLQHEPERLPFELKDGWASITQLLAYFKKKRLIIEKRDLLEAVQKHPDRQLVISGDKNRIRCEAR